MGRLDQQVKLRGIRIELGEIEQTLREYQGVRESVVVVHTREKEGYGSLVAYVGAEAHEENMTAGALRDYLQQRLPEIHGALANRSPGATPALSQRKN